MKARYPLPRLARWLFETSGVEEELAGDLAEEFARGCSRTRFWTETLAATWLALHRTAPRYRRSSLTGALSGLTASWLLITLTSQLMLRVGWLSHAVDWRGPDYLTLLLMGFLCTAAAGCIVARSHRAHPVAALVGFVVVVMTAPLWKLPFIARLYPTVFRSSIEPHLMFLILSLICVAPLSILLGGRMAVGRSRRQAAPR